MGKYVDARRTTTDSSVRSVDGPSSERKAVVNGKYSEAGLLATTGKSTRTTMGTYVDVRRTTTDKSVRSVDARPRFEQKAVVSGKYSQVELLATIHHAVTTRRRDAPGRGVPDEVI